MHIEAFGLTPRTSLTTFVTQHGKRPFGFSWYQGEIETDDNGHGIADFTGIFRRKPSCVAILQFKWTTSGYGLLIQTTPSERAAPVL
jgi:hypothetical protein